MFFKASIGNLFRQVGNLSYCPQTFGDDYRQASEEFRIKLLSEVYGSEG